MRPTVFTIDLAQPRDLFATPDTDPMAGRFETTVGMEQLIILASRLGRRRLAGGGVTLNLPASQVIPGVVSRLQRGIRGFCAERINDLDLKLEQLHRDGMQALLIALCILLVCTALGTAVGSSALVPDLLRNTVSEGLNIVGWVALWRPIELLLYDATPVRRERRVLAAIAAMPVTVVGR